MNATATHTTRWAQYLAQAQALTPPASTGPARGTALTAAEADRVQRHRDQLMAALRSQDRLALHCAKQQVLDAAFCPHGAAADHTPEDPAGAAGAAADSPALRRALRDLAWRTAGLLMPRHHRV